MKILTVDDSKTIRMIVGKALRSFDCQVLEAENGVVGLAVAARERPDLILLDYTMPVMDGFEVLARLRTDPDLKVTPVIMLTAEAGRDTVVKIAKLGVRDYLIKPFKEDVLIERIKRVLTLQPHSHATQRQRRLDDPINILVLDDKPAIVMQIMMAVSDTPWNVTGASSTAEAVDCCVKTHIDVVLASLSLPNDGAFVFFQNLRGLSATASIPVFGMAVRTATPIQARAQQAGFAGVVIKPIDPEEVKAKLARALKLETSYKYFQQRDSSLLLTVPNAVSQSIIQEISGQLPAQLTMTVEAGGDKLIVDLTKLEKAGLPLVELLVNARLLCESLALKVAVIGHGTIRADCQSYEETRTCLFATSFDEAYAALQDSRTASVA